LERVTICDVVETEGRNYKLSASMARISEIIKCGDLVAQSLNLLRTTLCNRSLYLETGLARGQQTVARYRKSITSIQCPAVLGKTVHHEAGGAEIAL
jgi:hypothetical protein